jgi:hypothetical protein
MPENSPWLHKLLPAASAVDIAARAISAPRWRANVQSVQSKLCEQSEWGSLTIAAATAYRDVVAFTRSHGMPIIEADRPEGRGSLSGERRFTCLVETES